MSPSTAQATAVINNVPVGTLIAYVGTQASLSGLTAQGWLVCDGSSLDVIDYPTLYAAIANAFGGGSNNFNLPDLRGMFVRGVDAGAGNDPDAYNRASQSSDGTGNTGDMVGTVQQDDFASHNHNFYINTASFNLTSSGSNWTPPQMNQSNTTDSTGGDETRPKNVYAYYLIFAGVPTSTSQAAS